MWKKINNNNVGRYLNLNNLFDSQMHTRKKLIFEYKIRKKKKTINYSRVQSSLNNLKILSVYLGRNSDHGVVDGLKFEKKI